MYQATKFSVQDTMMLSWQCTLRRLSLQAQQISLNYHCKCEQFVHFASGGFFNFNGTAGERCITLTKTASLCHLWTPHVLPCYSMRPVAAPGAFGCFPL